MNSTEELGTSVAFIRFEDGRYLQPVGASHFPHDSPRILISFDAGESCVSICVHNLLPCFVLGLFVFALSIFCGTDVVFFTTSCTNQLKVYLVFLCGGVHAWSRLNICESLKFNLLQGARQLIISRKV